MKVIDLQCISIYQKHSSICFKLKGGANIGEILIKIVLYEEVSEIWDKEVNNILKNNFQGSCKLTKNCGENDRRKKKNDRYLK